MPIDPFRARRLLVATLAAAFLLVGGAAHAASSGEAQWIWSPEVGDPAPGGVVYFRKAFRLNNPESGRIEIACDNRYELYVNGRLVGTGSDWRELDVYDIQRFLIGGVNVIAVKAENQGQGAAGLVARVIVKQRGNTDVSHSTDGTWRTTLAEEPRWQATKFNDSSWPKARALGELGETAPWNQDTSARTAASRFTVVPQFRVERVIAPDAAGSVVAMAFNERGELIISRERGPLMRVRDEDGDGILDTVHPYCDQVKNCHGLLPLNGDVFAVCEGPDKTGLYRISDKDADGVGETVKLLFKFKGGIGEHGPHAPQLGPDGMIYVIVGNHSGADVEFAESSPHHNYYEGDLVQPRNEDAGGHAVGVKAPGGTIIRTDLDGSFVELYCGGFRNAYDMTFNRQGEIFAYDSDMEWDEGLPWYRPTRVLHCTPGAEFGWRSGWAKWPDYFIDSLPAAVNTGRGSPTGVECYNHYMFPTRYQNAIFLADWSLGRILVAKPDAFGGTYEGKAELFVQGRPLNVTDLAVGPDGWLYFSTGGRDTEGGVYRVVYTGKVPPRPHESRLMQAIHQPQLYSAWGRNRAANIRRELGDRWATELVSVAESPKVPAEDRVRALDLMQLVGPTPSTSLLVKLSRDVDPTVRAKTADLMALHIDEATSHRLEQMLSDRDPMVRRKACDAMVRSGQQPPLEKLFALASEPSLFVAWSAGRALERIPTSEWQQAVLDAENPRLFITGSVALLTMDPDRATVDAVLEGCTTRLDSFLDDATFIDLLRVIQVALDRGKVPPGEVPSLAARLAEEYPSLEPHMNRELVRLLVYLQAPAVGPRLIEELEKTNNPIEERIHVAMYGRFYQGGWDTDQKLALLKFYDESRDLPGGHSFKGYLDNSSRDFVQTLSPDEKWQVLLSGQQMPNAALMALASLPEEMAKKRLGTLVDLDRQLRGNTSDAARRLSTGLVAVLGQSRDPSAMGYLREVFDAEPDRRQDAAMALAQSPDGENWDLLITALPLVEGVAAQEVISKLGTVNRTPGKPEALRQVILAGLKLRDQGGKDASKLLEKWTGEHLAGNDDSWEVALGKWQQWFAQSYPDQPPAQLPQEAAGARYTFDELLTFINSGDGAQGSAERGSQIFDKAQCVKCHRYGNRGEGVGPDLSGVSRRFRKKEILESVMYPSHVISDQYASKTVVSSDGHTYSGIVAPAGTDGRIVVLQSNGEKVMLAKDDVEEIAPSNKSAMPEGLFNNLSLEEIADLFAYLSKPPQ